MVLRDAISETSEGPRRRCRPESGIAVSRQAQRDLAARMRTVPGRFTGRLSAAALERVRSAAAAGRWEEAIEELITALGASAEPITSEDHHELSAVPGRSTLPIRPGGWQSPWGRW
jgi:hypothetical protein